MKSIQHLITFILAVVLSITTISCKKCKGEDPRARIINNGYDKASVQIKTSGGNTININNVDPGTSSAYNHYASGEVTFTITVKGKDYVKVFYMGKCYDYDIAIEANNNIHSSPIDRNR